MKPCKIKFKKKMAKHAYFIHFTCSWIRWINITKSTGICACVCVNMEKIDKPPSLSLSIRYFIRHMHNTTHNYFPPKATFFCSFLSIQELFSKYWGILLEVEFWLKWFPFAWYRFPCTSWVFMLDELDPNGPFCESWPNLAANWWMPENGPPNAEKFIVYFYRPKITLKNKRNPNEKSRRTMTSNSSLFYRSTIKHRTHAHYGITNIRLKMWFLYKLKQNQLETKQKFNRKIEGRHNLLLNGTIF